jgi:hypothetical protein
MDRGHLDYRSGGKRMEPMKSHAVRVVLSFAVFVALAACLGDLAAANGTVRETEFSTSLTEATGIVRIVVAVFGGLIGLLGIFVAIKGVGGTADVSGSISKHGKLSMKRVSQGVVITLIGAAVLIGALYYLPEKRTERELTGKEITIESEEGKKREVLAK